jgi:hypothetical protein
VAVKQAKDVLKKDRKSQNPLISEELRNKALQSIIKKTYAKRTIPLGKTIGTWKKQ